MIRHLNLVLDRSCGGAAAAAAVTTTDATAAITGAAVTIPREAESRRSYLPPSARVLYRPKTNEHTD